MTKMHTKPSVSRFAWKYFSEKSWIVWSYHDEVGEVDDYDCGGYEEVTMGKMFLVEQGDQSECDCPS